MIQLGAYTAAVLGSKHVFPAGVQNAWTGAMCIDQVSSDSIQAQKHRCFRNSVRAVVALLDIVYAVSDRMSNMEHRNLTAIWRMAAASAGLDASDIDTHWGCRSSCGQSMPAAPYRLTMLHLQEYFLLALSQPRPELSADGGASPVGTPLSPRLQVSDMPTASPLQLYVRTAHHAQQFKQPTRMAKLAGSKPRPPAVSGVPQRMHCMAPLAAHVSCERAGLSKCYYQHNMNPRMQAHLSLGSSKPKPRNRRAALSPAHIRKASVADEFADFLTEVRRGVAHGVRATSRLEALTCGKAAMTHLDAQANDTAHVQCGMALK